MCMYMYSTPTHHVLPTHALPTTHCPYLYLPPAPQALCVIQGVVAQFCYVAVLCWNVLIAWSLFAAIVLGLKHSDTVLKWYHAFVWTASLVLTAIPAPTYGWVSLRHTRSQAPQ